jgi:two-component system sensor histidine kinase UhpB
MAAVHMLTFPGLFAPSGLLGGNAQTTAWLYIFWHAGFPLAVMGYALLKRRADQPDENTRHSRLMIGFGVAVVLALAGGLALLATAGSSPLPAIIANNIHTSYTRRQ